MKKRLIVILLALLLMFATACGSNKSASAPQPTAGTNGYTQEMDTSKATAAPEDGTYQRKIIKNGTLDLETEDVTKAYASILAFAEENGGYEFKHEKSVRDDYVTITAQIKISPDKLDTLMNYAGNAAIVINSTTASDDVTSDYYDTQIRLATQKKSLEKYYEFLEEATTIEDTLRVQTEINNLTQEIEVLEGKIKVWDALVSESTLDLTISQVNDPQKPKEDIQWNALTWSSMGTMIKNGFISVSNVLVSILQWIAIILLSISPLLIIAGLILWIVLRKRKMRKSKRQQAQNQSIPPQNPDVSVQK